MAEEITNQEEKKAPTLEGGTYEILRNRMRKHGDELRARLDKLNVDRKETFGAIETALLSTERISTENNCVARDMVPVGGQFLFGYNVHLGLKTTTSLADVFSVYEYRDGAFHPQELTLLNDKLFQEDFAKLYQFYKETTFTRFMELGPFLYMVFRIGKDARDIKTFKWSINQDGSLTYLDARSDHEVKYPGQHEFEWTRTTRDMFRDGAHPHVSIEDRLFVETIGGDLTIKVEDNTEAGQGIYSEPVDNKDQTLDDAEIHYAILDNLILLKILPYQEQDYRYIVFNAKQAEARRIDTIAEACVLLPDDHGIIFANGYYLQTGEFKLFDNQLEHMIFERRIASPNGEDLLFIFYNRLEGVYLLLSYNLIAQQVATPIVCHGYSIFEDGKMLYFRSDDEPTKHHAVQLWQTPYVGPNYVIPVTSDSYLFKVGNKDIVRAMSESYELLVLLEKEDSYADLYGDLIRRTTDILDSYYWLNRDEAFHLDEPVQGIREAASAAVDEFEKVRRIRRNTEDTVRRVIGEADNVISRARTNRPSDINGYVDLLAGLRHMRGEVISLKDLRYVDMAVVEKYEAELVKFTETNSRDTVNFLLMDEALDPYKAKVKELEDGIPAVEKVVEANELEERINAVANELELLIDIVSNLDIEDATQTTRIIDSISTIYATFNQIRASLKRKRQELMMLEGQAEFAAQMKLVDQAVANYLEVADTPEKAEEYLTRVMVQLEEQEGKFSEFDEFVEKVSLKREEVYNAFESRKVALVEARNKRANTLMQAAERIVKAVKNRLERFEDVGEINAYMASDMMVEKARDIVKELHELGDSVKADSVESQLKSTKEEAVRQLKDRSELFVEGANTIKFGEFPFSVNKQNLDLTIVHRNDSMYYHLTGTGFFEEITDEAFLASRPVWEQSVVSENGEVYRCEYLAYQILQAAQTIRHHEGESEAEHRIADLDALGKMTEEELLAYVQQFMATRYNEGYVKGVHDADTALLLRSLVYLYNQSGLLRFTPPVRACAAYYWQHYAAEATKQRMDNRLKGVGLILQVFPNTHEFDDIIEDLQAELRGFLQQSGLWPEALAEEAGRYLFYQISQADQFVIDAGAMQLHDAFQEHLRIKRANKSFEKSVAALEQQHFDRLELIRHWLRAFLEGAKPEKGASADYLDEAAVLLFTGKHDPNAVAHVILEEDINGFQGSHNLLQDRTYHLHYHRYIDKMAAYMHTVVPMYEHFVQLKKDLTQRTTDDLRLSEFKPRVLSSFVRNKLIDKVYLPLIGANLAKQIGTAGATKRTDLMGMLLLISPPGYGKTTLMEYIANRLGIIFMKINGPAIGHEVTSLDPGQAPNSTAREELEKLALSFEMGDNVMIYLDDIQHCHPEFLQKFISLCDAQRKIEGVYKGRTKTYDFRGKKVAVVMAGNPYTESGDKFQIPDMLANRADIYNLGDIIGDSAEAFELSYIENSLTSNAILAKLAGKSQKDVLAMVRIAETGSQEGANFEASHSPEEVQEYVTVLKKLLVARDIVLKVNMQYIASAGQSDEYRTEPSFKLQGSYRNMNKISEKIAPIMNEAELHTLLVDHYVNESQTLTTGAEANLLKFKELYGVLSEEEAQRWADIKGVFMKGQKAKGYGGSQVGQVVEQMEAITAGLAQIGQALKR